MNRLRTWRPAAAAALIATVVPGGGSLGGARLHTDGLSTEHLTTPLGIDTATPRLSIPRR